MVVTLVGANGVPQLLARWRWAPQRLQLSVKRGPAYVVVGLVLVLPIIGAVLSRRLDASFGLTASYFSQANWTGRSFAVVDRQISTDQLRSRFATFGDKPFSVRWRGFLAIPEEGRYTFSTVSDDGSSLLIDGTVVVDNGGVHGPQPQYGEVSLKSGFHLIELQYQQAGGESTLDLRWQVKDRPSTVIPTTVLLHGSVSWASYRSITFVRSTLSIVPFVWLVIGEWWLLARLTSRWLRSTPMSPRHAAVFFTLIASSSALNITGVWWGLPGGWAPDELMPSQILDAISQGFSGGWHDEYPPLQYYLLAGFYTPFRVLASIANLDLTDGQPYTHLIYLNRLVCAQMGAGTLVAVYALAREIRDGLAGLIAVVITALVPIFVYYAKIANADVPYVFWSVWAMVFYARALTHDRKPDYNWFALLATLAICTKDQAYGLFILPSVHLATSRWRRTRGTRTSVWHTMFDPALFTAFAIAVAAFVLCHNLVFNWDGFVSHVALIFGRASGGYQIYQIFPASLQGQLQLLVSSFGELRWAFGLPMWIVVLVALAATSVDSVSRRRLWLLLPALSYYVFFVAVVLYNYDRFFLPVCILLAVLVGCWMSDLIERLEASLKRTIVLLGAGVVAYTFAYAASVDMLMTYDSRYVVEEWLRLNAPNDARIGTIGLGMYQPRINEPQYLPRGYDVIAARPEFIVLNVEHVARYPPASAEAALYAKIRDESSYRLALLYKTSSCCWPLATQRRLTNLVEDPTTNLDKINPQIAVYRRQDVLW